MNVPDLAIAAAGGWLALAALGTAGWSFAASKLKRQPEPPAYPPPVPPPFVRWLPTLPPVPLPAPRESDAEWLSPWLRFMPQTQVDRLFDDLITTEGLQ